VLQLRGKETSVTCDSCGRKIPRNKAVFDEKPIRYGTDLRSAADVRFFDRRKVVYCISCAKHRKIFEKKKRQAIQRSERAASGWSNGSGS
jgi:ribosomal protein S26